MVGLNISKFGILVLLALVLPGVQGCGRHAEVEGKDYPRAVPLSRPDDSTYTAEDAERMIKNSKEVLADVYAPLAEQIINDFDLNDKQGIGIDVGSGPGTLVIELARRTELHWINADINPHFFAHFYEEAARQNVADKVSAIFADVHALPFRNDFADIIISRGSFHLWQDKEKAFKEIYRVLKPRATAYVGRGFSRTLPIEAAKRIRVSQGNSLKYKVEQTGAELERIMNHLQIKDYMVNIPKPVGAEEVNYGIWLTFRKP